MNERCRVGKAGSGLIPPFPYFTRTPSTMPKQPRKRHRTSHTPTSFVMDKGARVALPWHEARSLIDSFAVQTASTYGQSTWESVEISLFRSVTTCKFPARLKERFADFEVREIPDHDGAIPLAFPSTGDADRQADVLDSVPQSEPANPEELCQELESLLGAYSAQLAIQYKASDEECRIPLPVALDKVGRTRVHRLLDALLNVPTTAPQKRRVESRTVNVDGVQMIGLSLVRNGSRAPRGGGAQRNSSRAKKKYLQFTLAKQGIASPGAVNLLAKSLRCPSDLFAIAGNKDKRGVTTQRVTVRGISATALVQAAQRFSRQMCIGDLAYVDSAAALGALRGNAFRVVLRDVRGDDTSALEHALECVKQNGFVNYFGMQRFGTGNVPLHEIGRALCSGRMEYALALLLAPRDGEPSCVTKAKEHLQETGDVCAALQMWSNHTQFQVEGQILRRLASQPTHLTQAFLAASRTNRTFYQHAYQSLVWNKIATLRLTELDPGRVVLGDLVIKRDSSQSEPVIVDQNNMDVYSIEDVVLPLVGKDIKFPQNLLAQRYAEILAADGVPMLGSACSDAALQLRGSYRHVVYIPRNLGWKIVSYDHANVPLLDGIELCNNSEVNLGLPGNYRGVILSFELPSGTYATMLVREVTRVQTFYDRSRRSATRSEENANSCEGEPIAASSPVSALAG